ncbi:hypothetical protein SAMN05216184_10171 [Georgenia satyanarayanai]|uniref:Uncharacterized protein n=1 Tax=Georgenia satyanarayanai TaxID=860221 RepID=A0A2Y9BUX8_9MICO|nr:hypothetical protein [Georgenia satyanarayanai]PYG01612.1 hypothetical protein A8987_10171 [Georgenia satyanarayanai]SSA36412.1 hypothetical protein SAMN05216184_10171 [Georgenia satyanarayanai]
MVWSASSRSGVSVRPTTTAQVLRGWDARRWAVAAAVAVGYGAVVGLATVIIPNPVFARDVPVVAWNYPVLVLTALVVGLLAASYVRPLGSAGPAPGGAAARRASRAGTAGGVLAWFAVGCPVCNKIALLALGYSGALTWFAPVQPLLAVLALALTGWALVVRLRGEIACPVPAVVARG